MDVQDVSRLLDYTSEMERGEDLERKDTISTRSKIRIYDVLETHSFYPSSSERRNGVDGWIEEDGDVRSQRPDLKKRASVGGTSFSASLVVTGLRRDESFSGRS